MLQQDLVSGPLEHALSATREVEVDLAEEVEVELADEVEVELEEGEVELAEEVEVDLAEVVVDLWEVVVDLCVARLTIILPIRSSPQRYCLSADTNEVKARRPAARRCCVRIST